MNEPKTVILKNDFFEAHKNHSEILKNKERRPYLTLVIQCNDKLFAIPFRSNVKHRYAFYFKTSQRKNKDIKGAPAIDFTKAVVITENDIERKCAIDSKEWIELNKNYRFIVESFSDYVKAFINSLNNGDFKKLPIFKFSALQYFIEEIVPKKLEAS